MKILIDIEPTYPGVCISREVASLAPNATLVEHWKEPEHQPSAKQAVQQFLEEHTPR